MDRREKTKSSWLGEVAKVISPKYPVLNVITQPIWNLYVERTVKIWNDQHPKGWLELKLSQVGYESLKERVKGVIGEGEETPDLFLMDSIWVAEFAKEGLIIPLEEVDPNIFGDHLKNFYLPIVKGDSWKGKHYAIRTGCDIPLLWYRKDWFEKEKVSPPETWDDLVKVATHFNQPSIKEKYGLDYPLVFVAGINGGEETTFTLLPFFWSNGGDLISDKKVALLSDQNRETLGYLKDLIHKHKIVSPEVVSYDWDVPGMLFGKGKVAMGIGGARPLTIIQENANWTSEEAKQKFGTTTLPIPSNGKRVANTGGMAYAICEGSKNKEVALDIIKLITGKEIMYEFCVKGGLLPVRKDVVEMIKSDFLIKTSKYLEFAKTRPNLSNYSEISRQFQTMLERALSESLSVEDALKGAAESVSFITGYQKI